MEGMGGECGEVVRILVLRSLLVLRLSPAALSDLCREGKLYLAHRTPYPANREKGLWSEVFKYL